MRLLMKLRRLIILAVMLTCGLEGQVTNVDIGTPITSTAQAKDLQRAGINSNAISTPAFVESYWYPAEVIKAIEKSLVKLSSTDKVKLAILEFPDLMGQVTPLGRFMAEELITLLVQKGRCDIVERLALGMVIQENKLALTGLIDPESVKKLGLILAVNHLIIGSVTDLGKEFRINLRILDVHTTRIIAAPQWSIEKDARSDYLWKGK